MSVRVCVRAFACLRVTVRGCLRARGCWCLYFFCACVCLRVSVWACVRACMR